MIINASALEQCGHQHQYLQDSVRINIFSITGPFLLLHCPSSDLGRVVMYLVVIWDSCLLEDAKSINRTSEGLPSIPWEEQGQGEASQGCSPVWNRVRSWMTPRSVSGPPATPQKLKGTLVRSSDRLPQVTTAELGPLCGFPASQSHALSSTMGLCPSSGVNAIWKNVLARQTNRRSLGHLTSVPL